MSNTINVFYKEDDIVNTNIIILAAGKGSRMKSALPKVLQPLANKPLLEHVLNTSEELSQNIFVVIGHGSEAVQARFEEKKYIQWVLQGSQLGTGHAVMQALPLLEENSTSLILYGDVPLIKKQTLDILLSKTTDKCMALLSVELVNPKGYGRIIRDKNNRVKAIVEEKDASDDERLIKEVNTGIMAVPTLLLKQIIPTLNNNNAQKEYYLTDIISLLAEQGIKIEAVVAEDSNEVQGINDKKQLAFLERAYQRQQAELLMEAGVTLIDPNRLDIRGELSTGYDVTIDVNCIFQGSVTLGDNVFIAPNCIIGIPGAKVVIASNVHIKPNSIIEQAIIGDECIIGPFARIREGTQLGKKVKIGNFVETKKTTIDDDAKVNHLSYIGDARIGKNVNVGAGTITCNYDGVNKHQTIIKDGAFIGSNTSLVAPIVVGENSTIGAGSTVNKDIENDDLAIARSKQKNIKGWLRPKKS